MKRVRAIRILGAGISGLTAAITLARAGYPVEVYEKNKKAVMRFDNDIHGLENWSSKEDVLHKLKRMGIDVNFDCDAFSSMDISNGAGKATAKAKRPHFYLVKRGVEKGTIDYSLQKQAKSLGASIYFGRRLPVEKADIIATGPLFNRVFAAAKGITFDTVHGDVAAMLLGGDMAYKGYSYLLITKNKGVLCTVVFHDFARLEKCYKNTEEYFLRQYNLKIENPRKAGGVGGFSFSRHFKDQQGKLYVGEAAGLQDFLWGFGLRYAIESGYLAATSIIKGMDYNALAEKQFRSRLKAGIVNRYLWERFGGRISSESVKHPQFFLKSLHSWHNFNLAQRVLYPKAKAYIKKKYPTAL